MSQLHPLPGALHVHSSAPAPVCAFHVPVWRVFGSWGVVSASPAAADVTGELEVTFLTPGPRSQAAGLQLQEQIQFLRPPALLGVLRRGRRVPVPVPAPYLDSGLSSPVGDLELSSLPSKSYPKPPQMTGSERTGLAGDHTVLPRITLFLMSRSHKL